MSVLSAECGMRNAEFDGVGKKCGVASFGNFLKVVRTVRLLKGYFSQLRQIYARIAQILFQNHHSRDKNDLGEVQHL
jgi:hypothetical protein